MENFTAHWVAILQPSDQLTAGYRSYMVATRNGELFTGLLSSESANSVTLPAEGGREQILLRKDIASIQKSELSLMPGNFADLLRPPGVANILDYLRPALAAGPPAVLTLFDEEKTFANLLGEGDGTATIVAEEKFSGDVCLRITPPQPFGTRISSWNYSIVERPEPGQYRFLRFAWKAPVAQGIMLELASDGQWPPPDKPLLRYDRGQNTTVWQARRLAKELPRDWTNITVDLQQDFGDFTLTGIAPTALGEPAFFDRIQLLRTLGGRSHHHFQLALIGPTFQQQPEVRPFWWRDLAGFVNRLPQVVIELK